jgi:tetratricopeptide (TPR) repeat protein
VKFDEQLRRMATVLNETPDLLVVRRAHRELEDEYRQRLANPATQWVIDPPASARGTDTEEQRRRQFLAHAAAVTMGAAVTEWNGAEPINMACGSNPYRRIGNTDVRYVEAATRALRALNYTYGSSFCLDAVLQALNDAERMLDALSVDRVHRRLLVALADLNNLAAWLSFDAGHTKTSRDYFARALELAGQGRNDKIVANALYRMGLVYMHQQAPRDALRLFQLGQIAAETAGSDFHVALLCAYEAWAYVRIGKHNQATEMLAQADADFARCTPAKEPEERLWEERFVQSLLGTVLEELTRDVANPALMLTSRASFYLVNTAGNVGVQTGNEALDLMGQLDSKERIDGLLRLRRETDDYSRQDVRNLSRRIDQLLRQAC